MNNYIVKIVCIVGVATLAKSMPFGTPFCGCIEEETIRDHTILGEFDLDNDNDADFRQLPEKCDSLCEKLQRKLHPEEYLNVTEDHSLHRQRHVSHFVLNQISMSHATCRCYEDLHIFDCDEEEGVPLVGVHCKTAAVPEVINFQHELFSPPVDRAFRATKNNNRPRPNPNSLNPKTGFLPEQPPPAFVDNEASDKRVVGAKDKQVLSFTTALKLGLTCVVVLVSLAAKTWYDNKQRRTVNVDKKLKDVDDASEGVVDISGNVNVGGSRSKNSDSSDRLQSLGGRKVSFQTLPNTYGSVVDVHKSSSVSTITTMLSSNASSETIVERL